jgi:SPP1 gp7 family putative phage head morphogenesis protein
MPAEASPPALLFAEPHAEALALMRGKPVMVRSAFDKLLPELRARAFTVTGIAGFDQLQRIRESVASIAEGTTWDRAKKEIIHELDWDSLEASQRRAELLLRTHGFQAFQSAQWEVAQKDEDTTHLQYLSVEDERVRPSHAALNGIVLPKDDPFWTKHYPPWEWGCRCRVRPMNPDLVDEARADDASQPPEDRDIIEGPALAQLNQGTLLRGGQRFDVTPPSDKPGGEKAFGWTPSDLRLPLDTILERYDPQTRQDFTAWAQQTDLGGGVSLLDSLHG